ncbi:MAG TPA: hypothetical protein VIW29_09010, partial [Polyangiaceae bacterium]
MTESRKTEPLADDQLSDKHPIYDRERVVVEEFDGCQVTLNKSASVTRLTLQSTGDTDDALRGKVFPSRGAALAALGGAPTLPTTEVVSGALKPFNDGLYAAVELAAESGQASRVNKHQLLLDLLAELTKRSREGVAAEQGPALAAAKHIATAFAVAGDTNAIDPGLLQHATQAAESFDREAFLSKPIGFYGWTPVLARIFARDRWLQQRYVPRVSERLPFAALAGLGLVVGQAGPLSDQYRRTLDLYGGVTDPLFDASPFDVAPFVPEAEALGDLADVEQRFAATLPVEYPDYPFCNRGAAAFPASESADNRLMRKLLCGGELAEGETLIDGLIRKIQSGELDLTPRPDSGFYDQQLYALQTLLLPGQASESEHLLLTRAYKEKLVETFKSLLIQTRETHVKQIAIVNARTLSAEVEAREFTLYPKLVVEPFPTFYLRTARAYRFLQGVLDATLGPDFLVGTARLLEDGTRAQVPLGQELTDKQRLLYGLHLLSADSIGMAPELADDEALAFPVDEARAGALAWLQNVGSDEDVARDPRVSLPVATDRDYAIYWAVVGVKVLHL